MKKLLLTFLFVAVVALSFAVFPAVAQLGDTDVSSFTVQNISTNPATVSVTFVDEAGVQYQPASLGGTITNPFVLQPGTSQQVYVPNIPVNELPTGRYAVVISSDEQVVAQAGIAGTGTRQFTGSYVGFDSGSTEAYLAGVNFNFFGWYSMISVQNLGAAPADVTVTITCSNGTVGTLSQTGIPAYASYTWALKNTTPTGFTAATVCDGAATISADQNIVAVNNNNRPANGNTNTFGSAAAGGDELYVPSLSNNYFNWYSALTILKLSSGDATVTVSYDDGDPDDTCNLTDAIPSCKLIMSNEHTQTGRFSAVVSAPGAEVIAIAGSSYFNWSGATAAVLGGSEEVAIPNVAKNYYGWISAINCQNVGATTTSLNVSYAGYGGNAYNTPDLDPGESIQILVANEGFLPSSWQGGATVLANTGGAAVACTVGNSNPANAATMPGDWTSQYNAVNK